MIKKITIIPGFAIIPPDPFIMSYEEAITITTMAFMLVSLIIMILSAIYNMRRQTDTSRQWTNKNGDPGETFWEPSEKNKSK